MHFTAILLTTKWDFETLEWRRARLSIWLSGKVFESGVKGGPGGQCSVYPALPPAPRAGAEVRLSWNPEKVEGKKRDWKLAPRQLCKEFRAGVDGACAPNQNSCAKCARAKSSWTWVDAGANVAKGSIGASTNTRRRIWCETQIRPSSICYILL